MALGDLVHGKGFGMMVEGQMKQGASALTGTRYGRRSDLIKS